MKTPKWIIIISLAIVVLVAWGIFFLKEDKQMEHKPQYALEQRAQNNPHYYPKIIHELPQGFIAFGTTTEVLEGVVDLFFFETSVSIRDSKGHIIFTTVVSDSSFIIIHNNAYYVNEEKFSEIVDNATKGL